MALFNFHNPWVFTFGILGNLVSFMVYLAPVPTFYRIFKKKSTEGFHAVPYVVALLSSMLWICYALLKSNEILLITINSVGCVIEAIYITIFLSYASKKARMCAVKLLLLLNFCGFGFVLVFTQFLVKGPAKRVAALGWVSVLLSASVYVAPLSIMRRVIRTRSVEFMPVSLSFALSLNAVMWFFYGLLLKDFYIAVPNIADFVFGLLQIVLYVVYKDSKPVEQEDKLPAVVTPKTTVLAGSTLPIDGDDDHQSLEVVNIEVVNVGTPKWSPQQQWFISQVNHVRIIGSELYVI